MPRAPERSLPEGHGPGYMELLRCRDLWGVSLGLFSLSYFQLLLPDMVAVLPGARAWIDDEGNGAGGGSLLFYCGHLCEHLRTAV
jgi:hypothetical protein